MGEEDIETSAIVEASGKPVVMNSSFSIKIAPAPEGVIYNIAPVV
jgi:hypothetical protein